MQSYGSKVTPVGPLDAEKTVYSVFFYIFEIAFTASLFKKNTFSMSFFRKTILKD